MKSLDKEYILHRLEEAVFDAGSQAGLARKVGVSRALLNHVLKGKRHISSTILDYLGYEEVVSYRRKA